MKKLLIVTLAAGFAAASFAPVAQAKRRMMKPAAAPMMMAPMNPRVAPNGDFYATPVNAGPDMRMGMGMMNPLGVPGAVVGGVAQPVGDLGAGLGAGLGTLVPTP